MSSLITKTNKSRATATRRASGGKKSASAKKIVKKATPSKSVAKPKASAKSVAPKATPRVARAKSAKSTPKKVQPAKKARSVASVVQKPKKKVAKASPPVRVKSAKRSGQPGHTSRQQVRQAEAERRPVSVSSLVAIKEFERALKLFNEHNLSAARTALSRVLSEFGETEISRSARTYLAICEQKLAHSPASASDPDSLYNLGVFELNRGNLAEAVKTFEKVLKAEPRSSHVFYSLAVTYLRSGDLPRSIEMLRRAITLNAGLRSHARHDPDLLSLRNNREFQRVTGLDQLEY